MDFISLSILDTIQEDSEDYLYQQSLIELKSVLSNIKTSLYKAKQQSRFWSQEEHDILIQILIQNENFNLLTTKSKIQIRSHLQKFKNKIQIAYCTRKDLQELLTLSNCSEQMKSFNKLFDSQHEQCYEDYLYLKNISCINYQIQGQYISVLFELIKIQESPQNWPCIFNIFMEHEYQQSVTNILHITHFVLQNFRQELDSQ
ncbi:hypothetical protein SS50377_27482 [Spironucleus salmonicida]|uniref:Uncharacterized protein n=1 Tax=Spironucleus salmonicida TaxID=348837 RepID=V6M172_9EUKA|nr:hypothetical protein SS50377_27482 [Spironucleus salmonicida]|eukprot:EST46924.1 Hypothetical protein SS50377_13081 [Spironucleus salmonicida]